MELYEYLLEQYGYGEPIFSKDLQEELNIKSNALRQRLKRLVDNGKIERCKFKNGIYFIAKPNSIISTKAISVNKIITKKYIVENENRIGYVTGLDFANSINLTTQVPVEIEIVTEKETNKKRKVEYNERRVILRRAKTKITDTNYKIFQILELLNNFKKCSDVSFDSAIPNMMNYVKDVEMDENELKFYIGLFPNNVKENFIKGGLFDEVAQRHGRF